MPVFPSFEWMADFCEQLESHPDAPDVAGALDGVYRFVVDPAGPLAERHSYDVSIRPTGAGAKVGIVDRAESAKPRLTMSTDYRRWQQLVRGELDVGMAMVLRRLRVSGELTRLMGSVSTARPLVDALHEVNTTWLEDA